LASWDAILKAGLKSGSGFPGVGARDQDRHRNVRATIPRAELMVRIRFPPAASLVRTCISRSGAENLSSATPGLGMSGSAQRFLNIHSGAHNRGTTAGLRG
jgi:hypothetical protein